MTCLEGGISLYRARLRAAGLRVTEPRILVYETLREAEAPPSGYRIPYRTPS